jgi:hypothetical protein
MRDWACSKMRTGVFATLACLLFVAMAACGGRSGPTATMAADQPTTITRTVTLPVQITEPESAGSLPNGTLAATSGGPDELPEGPNAFAVLANSGLAVSDPVRRRIAIFDNQGAFQREIPTVVAVDRLIADPSGSLLAHGATADDWRRFDPQGRAAPEPTSAPAEPPPARLAAPNQAFATAAGHDIPIKYEEGGSRLASVENLGSDPKGNIYVALEIGDAQESVQVRKIVRKYSPQGAQIAEIRDIPLDGEIRANDDLRLHGESVYQMVARKDRVRINMWDTSGARR